MALAATALALLPYSSRAQTNVTTCSDTIGSSFKIKVNTTTAVRYNLSPLCVNSNYSATNSDGRFSFAFNFGAFSSAPCAPYPSSAPPASFGVVTQFLNNDAPASGLCPLASGGESIPCTPFCYALSGIGAPVPVLQSYDTPFSGLDLVFPDSTSYAWDPYPCSGMDPQTGEPLNRRVVYNLTCDTSVSRVVVDSAEEVTLCRFVISIRSKFACGEAVAI